MIARWLNVDPMILIFDEPTKGVDIAAKAEIYRLINNLATRGKAIILISSELIEIAELCGQIIVMRDGKITEKLKGPLAPDGVDKLFELSASRKG